MSLTSLCQLTKKSENREQASPRLGFAICRLFGDQESMDMKARQDEASLLQAVGCRNVELK